MVVVAAAATLLEVVYAVCVALFTWYSTAVLCCAVVLCVALCVWCCGAVLCVTLRVTCCDVVLLCFLFCVAWCCVLWVVLCAVLVCAVTLLWCAQWPASWGDHKRARRQMHSDIVIDAADEGTKPNRSEQTEQGQTETEQNRPNKPD